MVPKRKNTITTRKTVLSTTNSLVLTGFTVVVSSEKHTTNLEANVTKTTAKKAVAPRKTAAKKTAAAPKTGTQRFITKQQDDGLWYVWDKKQQTFSTRSYVDRSLAIDLAKTFEAHAATLQKS